MSTVKHRQVIIVIGYYRSGWPSHQSKGELGKYWNCQGEMSLSDDLLLRIWCKNCHSQEYERGDSSENTSGSSRDPAMLFMSQNLCGGQKSQKTYVEALVKSCPGCQKLATLPRQPI